MNTVYLHGLDSPQGGPKVDFLEDRGHCYAPALDYRNNPDVYKQTLERVKRFQQQHGLDLIIGSSMGGYFGYHIANYLNVPTLLFNPAIDSRSVQPADAPLTTADYPFRFDKTHRVVCGGLDDVVLPVGVFSRLAQDKVRAKVELEPGLGHRIPYEMFISKVGDETKKYPQ